MQSIYTVWLVPHAIRRGAAGMLREKGRGTCRGIPAPMGRAGDGWVAIRLAEGAPAEASGKHACAAVS